MTEPDTNEEQEYLLGTGDDEVVRLGFQHQVWSAVAARGWERAGFGPGQRLLDVGCGPGHATFDLQRLVGREGEVMAVDLSQRFITFLLSQLQARGVSNVTASVQDVEALDLPERSFDGAYARWVLCFLRDPEATVAGVARALRPGASFVVQDYLHYIGVAVAPASPAFRRVFEAVVESWRADGGDPNVGTRVPALMRRCGLEVREIRPISRIARPGSALWRWPETFFAGHIPRLVDWGFLTEDEAAAWWQEWEARSSDPAAFFLTPPMVEVIGTRP
ncbi:MAG TPA: methyltransferase domain-containing protein [Longimicrobiaceae bacterium]|nr:methyltransferase domain-containing protein [Longimicrobiaceae bacterium]